MIKAIIYKSNTGHTLQYAQMISKKLNIPCYTIKEAKKQLEKYDEVIYLGWVCANKICGLGKVKNKYKINCYGAVGAYPQDKEYLEALKKFNNIDKPLFYLRGGIDYTKLKGIKKKIVQMVGKTIEENGNDKNEELKELFLKGANYVTEENTEELIKYIKNI